MLQVNTCMNMSVNKLAKYKTVSTLCVSETSELTILNELRSVRKLYPNLISTNKAVLSKVVYYKSYSGYPC